MVDAPNESGIHTVGAAGNNDSGDDKSLSSEAMSAAQVKIGMPVRLIMDGQEYDLFVADIMRV